VLKVGRQRAELGYRIRTVEADAARASADAHAAEERLSHEQSQANEGERGARGARVATRGSGQREHEGQAQQFELVRQAASSRAAADSNATQVQRLQSEYTTRRHTAEQRASHRAALAHALNELSQTDADVQARLSAARGSLGELHADRDALADRTQREQARLEGLRVRQSDLRGRLDVLEDLERSFEGIGAGVRQVLAKLTEEAESETAPESPILGMVADLLTVPRDVAALVELALGDTAQRFRRAERRRGRCRGRGGGRKSRGASAFCRCSALDLPPPAPPSLKGRGEKESAPAGFVFLPHDEGARLNSSSPLLFREGGLGGVGSSFTVLASFVTCDDPNCPKLPEQLLGRVLLVETLADARRLAALHPACRVIARSGELLEPDGTLTVGPLKAGAGLVSRKSELRELREHHRVASESVATAEVELADLRKQADAVSGVLDAVSAEIALLSDEAGDVLQRIAVSAPAGRIARSRNRTAS